MKGMKTRRVLGVAIAMMVLLAVSAVPAMACPCEEVDKVAGNPVVGDPTELTGAESSKILDMALKNSQVKELQKQLEKEGFTQKDIKAYTVPVTTEDGSVAEIQVVTIGFESSSAEADKQMTFACNPETGGTVVVLGTGWDCVLCTAALAGCAACAYSCTIIGTACILCIAATCPAALYQCTVCCCSLGNQWCCDRLEW